MLRKTTKTGPELLREFIRAVSLTDAAAAEQIGVSRSVLVDWMGAKSKESSRPQSVPRIEHRLAIEKWSSGRVPAESWLTSRELEAVNKTRPAKAG